MAVTRPALLIGGVILAAALGTAGAWLVWPRQASSPRTATATETKPAPDLAAIPAKPDAEPATPIVVPQAVAPPEPTSAEFARAAAPPETPASRASEPAAAAPAAAVNWTNLPIDELRTKANADELPAMEEMARRLVQGVGVPKDQQAGAGWLLRAAQHGSAQSAFNVGVMYERGFVVERDSTRAVAWYRKAADANWPMAKHHLALMLREGKGAPRNAPETVDLLRAASRQGLAVSMFTLGDIYERGDVLPKDPAMALAWYAITAEFERQTNRSGDNALAKTAEQRAQVLRSTLLPGDLERAQQAGQREFKQIVDALQPPKPPPPLEPSALPPAALPAPALPPAAFPVPAPNQAAAADSEPDPPGWPKAANDQISAIQQALFDLKLLSDKPDGAIGPMTRAAIRTFQRSIGARETGEPTKDVFAALQGALAHRGAAASAPPAPPVIDLGAPEPPAPPTSADIARAAPQPEEKMDSAKVEPATAVPAPIDPPKPPMPAIEAAPAETVSTTVIDLGQPEPPPAPPTSADIARADPDAWPTSTADQMTAIQRLLRDLNILRDPADGLYGPTTRAAILDYERTAGLAQTGEPSKALFESLREAVRKSVTSP